MQANAEDRSSVLGGKYRLQYPIGAATSTVYAADRKVDGAVVAVRVFLDAGPNVARRLEQAAVAAGRVQHPMVAAVLDYGIDDDGTAYVVSEFVDGTPLYAWADAVGIPPIGTVVDFVHRLCLGMQAASREGLTHSALGPQNILVLPFTFGADSRVAGKLLDLGVPDGMRAVAPSLPSAQFVAPEQLIEAHAGWSTASGAGARANVYSTGAVLYYLCTGGVPYPARNIRELAAARADGKPLRPARINPQIPAPLNAIMLRALSTDPGERYPSVSEMAEALAFSLSSVESSDRARSSRPPARQSNMTIDMQDEAPTGQVALPPDGLPPAFGDDFFDSSEDTPPRPSVPVWPAPAPHGSFSSAPSSFTRSSAPPLPSVHPEREPSGAQGVLQPSVVGVQGNAGGVGARPSELPSLRTSTSGVAARVVPASPEPVPLPPQPSSPRVSLSSRPPPVPGAASPFPRGSSGPPPLPKVRAPGGVVTGGAAAKPRKPASGRVVPSVGTIDDEVTSRIATAVSAPQYAPFDVIKASPLLKRLPLSLVASTLVVALVVGGLVTWLALSRMPDPKTVPIVIASKSAPAAPGDSPVAMEASPQAGHAAAPAAVDPSGEQAGNAQSAPAVAPKAGAHLAPVVRKRSRATRALGQSRSKRVTARARPAKRPADPAAAVVPEPAEPVLRGSPNPYRFPAYDGHLRAAPAPQTGAAIEPTEVPPAPSPKAEPVPAPEVSTPSAPSRTAPLRAQASLATLEVRGSLTTSTVRRALGRRIEDYAACYSKAAKRARRNGFGAVSVSMEIDLRGRVRKVKTGPGELPGLSSCIGKATTGLATNTTPDTGTVRASFRVTFSP